MRKTPFPAQGPDAWVEIESETERYAFRGLLRIVEARLRYRRSDGEMSKPVTRVNFARGDAVGVLLHDPRQEAVVLVRQFRYPVYAGLSEEERRGEGARQAWLLVLRHRALSGVMAAALLLLAGLSVYTIVTTRASERAAHASRLEAEKSNASAQQALSELEREQELRRQLAEPALHQVLADARQALREGDIPRAMKAASLAVAVGPGSREAWMAMGMLKLVDEEFPDAARAFRRAADVSAVSPASKRKPDAGQRGSPGEQALRLSELAASVGEPEIGLTSLQIRPVLARLIALETSQKMAAEIRPVVLGILQRRNARNWKSALHRDLLEWAGNQLAGGRPAVKLTWRDRGGMLHLTVDLTGTGRFSTWDLLRGLPMSSLSFVGKMPPAPAQWPADITIRRVDLRRADTAGPNALAGLGVEELVVSPTDSAQRTTWTRIKGLKKVYVCPPGRVAGEAALKRRGVAVEPVTEVPPLEKRPDSQE